MFSNFKNQIMRNFGNLPGLRIPQKLVLFIVDDYGSIRMSSKQVFSDLIRAGLHIENCRYNRLETIESNTDLEDLFEVLCKFKDCKQNHPVFTPLALVVNPDFEKIRINGFQHYYYEPFPETLKRYPDHDRVYDLWRQGIENRIFLPEFHGREHLNVARWMSDLQKGVPVSRLAFEHGVTGIGAQQAEELCGDYQAAFDIDNPDDWVQHRQILQEGLPLFKELFGYEACFFTPPNGLYCHRLDEDLKALGVDFINVSKLDREPLGNNRYRRTIHYMGQRNKHGQRYIVRTAQFEPSESCGINWVDKCLSDIKIAFRWKKPAIISSHRVNFCGHLDPKNRARGLAQLEKLLREILKNWPDVEFIAMRDLGEIMTERS